MEIKTKYNIGDKVWVLLKNVPQYITIEAIVTNTSRFHTTKTTYVSKETLAECSPFEDGQTHLQMQFNENSVFPTKEKLLKSL